MSELAITDSGQFVLPSSVVGKLDVARLVTEFENLDDNLTSIVVRAKAGVATESQPAVSSQLTDFLVANQLHKIGDSAERSQLVSLMRRLKDKAPVVHMTFATNADQESLSQLADWVRQSVHPQALISVGLQPELIGGVHIRTTNQVHDFSVRAQLAGHRDLLVKEVEALSGVQ